MTPPRVSRFQEAEWDEITQAISSNDRIVVLSGAGISTNSGIADFRSRDGLFSRTVEDTLLTLWRARGTNATRGHAESVDILDGIDREHRKMKGHELFNHSVYAHASTARAFHRLCTLMRESTTTAAASPGQLHRLVHDLQRQGRLLTWLTQNIDGLETVAGMRSALGKSKITHNPETGEPTPDPEDARLIQLHGSLEDVTCRKCRWTGPWKDDLSPVFLEGQVPDCPRCVEHGTKRRRERRRPVEPGVLRPGVVLYGEEHPHADEIADLMKERMAQQPTLLLIVGTSLATAEIKKLVQDVANVVHQHAQGLVVYVNATSLRGGQWDGHVDYQVVMDCDEWATGVINAEPKVWHALMPKIAMHCRLSSARSALHESTRNLSRSERDLVWLDAFF